MGYIALHTVKHDGKTFTQGQKVPVNGDAAKRLIALDAIVDEKAAPDLTAKAKVAVDAKVAADAEAAAAAEADKAEKLRLAALNTPA